VRQAQANAQNIERQAQRRQRLSDLAENRGGSPDVREQRAGCASTIPAGRRHLDQARVNLERTKNPLPGQRLGNKTCWRSSGTTSPSGKMRFSLVDGDSFWVDGYFEETKSQLDPRR